MIRLVVGAAAASERQYVMPLRHTPICGLVVIMGIGCSAARTMTPSTTPPSVSSLTENPIVGSLGVPLGTVAEVQASVVDGSKLRMKRYQSSYLLRVTEVDGHALARPTVMEFSVPAFVSVKLANNPFDLYELKTGKKTGKLDSTDELEKDYVGKRVRLVVYETGRYSGIPRNLPDDVPVWQDRGFGFSTSLVVLAERE